MKLKGLMKPESGEPSFSKLKIVSHALPAIMSVPLDTNLLEEFTSMKTRIKDEAAALVEALD
jgi:hypothetical protein